MATYASKPFEYENISDTTCLDRWGDFATEFASDLLDGQTVTVVSDPKADERDIYDRLLGYIHINGQDFGASMVEGGYARVTKALFARKISHRARVRCAGLESRNVKRVNNICLVGPVFGTEGNFGESWHWPLTSADDWCTLW